MVMEEKIINDNTKICNSYALLFTEFAAQATFQYITHHVIENLLDPTCQLYRIRYTSLVSFMPSWMDVTTQSPSVYALPISKGA